MSWTTRWSHEHTVLIEEFAPADLGGSVVTLVTWNLTGDNWKSPGWTTCAPCPNPTARSLPSPEGRALPVRRGVHLVRRWWSVLWILCPVKGTSRQAWLGCLWYSSSNLLGHPFLWGLRPLSREGGQDAFWQWQSERDLKRGFNAWPSAEKTLKTHPSPPNCSSNSQKD